MNGNWQTINPITGGKCINPFQAKDNIPIGEFTV
jgi:hypothetical protein